MRERLDDARGGCRQRVRARWPQSRNPRRESGDYMRRHLRR